MVIGLIASVTEKFIWFFVPEILTWVFIEKSGNRFKFRFGGIEGHPNLKPFANTWTVGFSILIITFLTPDIFQLIFGQTIHSYLLSVGWKIIFLLIALFSFSMLWIVNYLLEKNLDRNSYIFIAISIISILLYFLIDKI